MMDPERGPGLGTTFMKIIIGILALSTLIVTIMTANNEIGMLHHFLEYKGQSMASYIAKLSQDPLVLNDRIRLDFFVNEANKDEDVVFAVIYDRHGELVTSKFAGLNYRSELLKTLLAGLPKESELKEVIAAMDRSGGEDGGLLELPEILLGEEHLMEVTAPILSGDTVIGTVAIGMSEHKVYDYVIATIAYLVVLNLVAACVLAVVLFSLAKRVVFKPISELARTSLALAQGDLSARVAVASTGELQTLVDSFNAMAQALAKRTMELVETRDELVRSEKMALLGLLAGNMGNELRNPLGVMSNAVFYLETVLPDNDPTVWEYLGIIRSEINSAHEIITDLIDFVRNKKPVGQRIGARDLAGRALSRCDIPKEVLVRNEIPEALPPLLVDPTQVEQVVKNLIANALQAMPGGGMLTLTAVVEGETLRLRVTDTGEGISRENLSQLFTPLFSTRSRGMGLGLACAAKLVEAAGGRIEVASREGEGATFIVSLPVAQEG